MSAERNGVSCFGAILDDPIEAECQVCNSESLFVGRFCWWFGFQFQVQLATTSESPRRLGSTWSAAALQWFAGRSQVDHAFVAAPGSGHSSCWDARRILAAASQSHFADARFGHHCQLLEVAHITASAGDFKKRSPYPNPGSSTLLTSSHCSDG